MSQNNNRLSVARVLRVLTQPICQCATCGVVRPDNPVAEMVKAGFYMEEDGEHVRIELTPHALKALRDRKIPGVDELTGGKGPFFEKEGKLPHIKHVATISAAEILRIWAENHEGIDLVVVRNGVRAVSMAG